ncbi:hypothetical protein QVD17_15828 [Tagetes erecta]|uniref:NAC domain-containing protein n=1 Tax=Tagetes erecta TaxID=13708 RepID=A0AAD8KPW1_TARER|nr:hypothetical protein QVD17_15828 [Tagetes erecta]
MVAPGFRFYPTEEELISFYLKHKIEAASTSSSLQQNIDKVIPQLHVYDFYPWDLPQYAGEHCKGDTEQWFFFIPRQEKEARGGRPSRQTSSGYWKATGSMNIVYSSSNRAIGIKRTMVFYNGRAPTGTKTKWKMNEYKAFQSNTKPTLMGELSLCRIYLKSNCLRAFDRRPSGVMIEQQPLQNQEHHATTSTPSSILQTTTTSSSSGGHDSLDDQTVYVPDRSTMESDDQQLWDWDELNKWF